ncbi:hypothetical protein Avbf_02472 [Armadillidium vulgare]|nr:hypothetical protein Avbf_02472 [Armadillidium vulgare]
MITNYTMKTIFTFHLRNTIWFISGKGTTTTVICTLESIDSIKSLKRSPQHIFVEVRVPGSEFQVPGYINKFWVTETNQNLYSIQIENLSLLCTCPQKDSPSLLGLLVYMRSYIE